MDGSCHLSLSALVTVPHGSQTEKIVQKAMEAWTALRYQVPTLAGRCFRLPGENGIFALRYTVPQSRGDVQAWINPNCCGDQATDIVRSSMHLH